MSSLPNNVVELFRKGKQTFSEGKVMAGAWWPEQGTHAVLLEGHSVSADEQEVWLDEKNSKKYPCVIVRFKYRMVDALPGETEPRTWQGSRFVFLPDITALPEARRKRFELDRDKIYTAYKAILGERFTGDPMADAAAVDADLAAKGAIGVEVYVNHRKDKNDPKKTYPGETLQRRLD